MGKHLNPRILVTVSDRVNNALVEYKSITGTSKSKTISELLNAAVEQLEDANKQLAKLKRKEISVNELIKKSAQFGHQQIDDLIDQNKDFE